MLYYNHKQTKYLISILFDTYDSARGFSLRRLLGVCSASVSEPSERVIFSLLDAPFSRSTEAALFFFPPFRGEPLSASSSSSSSSHSWEEWASVSPDTASEVPLRRRPPLASLPFFLAFFSGA